MAQIFGFDIETTPFVEGKTVKLKLWTLYNPHRQYHGYYKKDLLQVIQRLYRELEEIKEDIVIVAHNLPFDYINSINKIPITVVSHKQAVINILNKPAFAIFPNRPHGKGHKTHRLYFVDLLNFVSGKLKHVAEAFGVSEKMDKDSIYLPRTDPKLLEYCMNDSKICYQVLNQINPFFKGKFKMTAASLSFPRLKEESGWKFFIRPWWAMTAERKAYYGGRVQINRHMKIDPTKWYKARKYDINSMYTYIMRTMKVAVGWAGKHTRRNGAYTDATAYDYLKSIYESDDRTAVVKASVQLLSDALPYREDKLYFDAQDENGDQKSVSQGYWCIEELFPALRDREANLIYVSSVYLYKAKRGMFEGYCDKWYDIKQQSGPYGSDPNPIKYFMSKLFLNTPYGKFGQKKRVHHNYKEIVDKDTIKWLRKKRYYTLDYPKNKTVYKVEVASGVISISEQINQDVAGACCAVAAAVTALARRYLWEALRDYQWLYCDTDSMILLDPHEMDPMVVSDTELGFWKFETCSAELEVCEYQIKGRKASMRSQY